MYMHMWCVLIKGASSFQGCLSGNVSTGIIHKLSHYLHTHTRSKRFICPLLDSGVHVWRRINTFMEFKGHKIPPVYGTNLFTGACTCLMIL